MKKLSRLLLVLGLMLCISLTAYAEDAPAAQPTAKEPRTLTARTGTEILSPAIWISKRSPCSSASARRRNFAMNSGRG